MRTAPDDVGKLLRGEDIRPRLLKKGFEAPPEGSPGIFNSSLYGIAWLCS